MQKIANQAGAFASIQPPASPAQIVGANGGSFYIDKGENYGILVGQRYEVHRVIDEIRDASGNLLDSITDAVGLLEVTRVLGQSAICNVIEGEAAEGDSGGRPGRDPDVSSPRRVWRAGPVAEDDERPRVHQRAH